MYVYWKRSRIRVVSIIVLLIGFCSGSAHASARRELIFVPLPIEQQEAVVSASKPLVAYLSRQLGQPVTIRYESNYEDILRLFKEGKVDIVQLGPLPYTALTQIYNKAVPLVAIRESDGKVGYTCAMVTAFDGPTSVKQVKRSVALAQPLSTCGHMTAGDLFEKHGRNLEDLHHAYLGNQDKVALAVVRGTYEVGTMKTALARKYSNLTLRVVEETPVFPGFLLVGNGMTLSREQQERIITALLQMGAEDRSSMVLGKHGFAKVADQDYDVIRRHRKYHH